MQGSQTSDPFPLAAPTTGGATTSASVDSEQPSQTIISPTAQADQFIVPTKDSSDGKSCSEEENTHLEPSTAESQPPSKPVSDTDSTSVSLSAVDVVKREFLEPIPSDSGRHDASTDIGAKVGSDSANLVVKTQNEDEQDERRRDGQEEVEEQDGEESDSDEENLPPLQNPSTDIRNDLEDSLSGPLEFQGSFYFNKTYAEAPNPALRLADLGNIGLPLNEREAKVVISRCIQAPFGKGERQVVDTSVRDTWEMDASQVQCDNPVWHAYMNRVLREVCSALGVDFAVSKPRCELYKLLLYETGSHFLPHRDTQKVDGMFATVIVVLPSQFSGGAACLSHGNSSEVIDCSPTSLGQTTVLSWYTDVTHEIKPITGGYRLALSYNLIHTTEALPPTLPSDNTAIERIRHVLLSWKQLTKTDSDEYDCPSKLVYLLEHQYASAGLKESALKGIDAHKLSVLKVIAQEHGFHLGLACVECHLIGMADDYGGYGRHNRYNRRWGRYSSPLYDDDDDNDVSMAEVEEREMSITDLVELDGTRIRDSLECDDEETVPENLRDTVESGSPDEQEYEGYMGNHPGSIDQWYRRTVLVIWPDSSHFDIVYGDGNYKYAFDDLQKTVTSKPTRRERELMDYVLGAAVDGRLSKLEVLKRLCATACMWEDLTLWLRIIRICQGDQKVGMITTQGFLKAIETFGFEAVRTTMETVLQNDPGNEERYGLLREMSQRVANQPHDEALSLWVAEQQRAFLRSLKKPSKAEMNLLVQVANENGGLPFLKDTVIPQILGVADAQFLLEFASLLISQKPTLANTEEEMSLADDIVKFLLLHSIQMADFFKPVAPAVAAPPYGYNYGRKAEENPDPQIALSYIKTCVQTGNESLLEVIFGALLTPPAIVTTSEVQKRVTMVLLPLISPLQETIRASQTTAASLLHLDVLCRTVVDQWSKNQTAPPAKKDLSTLLDASILSGSPVILSSTILPKLKSIPCDENVLRQFIEEIHARRGELAFPSDSNVSASSITTDLANFVLRKTPIQSTTAVVECLEFCRKIEIPASYALILRRVLTPGEVTPHYIKHILVPLIPELRKFLLKYHLSPVTEPFASTFKAIMVGWLNKFLGPKPSEASAVQAIASVKKLDCKCDYCQQVVRFLTSSPDPRLTLSRIGAPKRRHVETYLERYCRSAATWTMIRSTPQGLDITKSNCIQGPAAWNANQVEARTILKNISSDSEELKKIFGADYQALEQRIQGDAVESRSMTSSTSTSATQGYATNAASSVSTSTGPFSRPFRGLPVAQGTSAVAAVSSTIGPSMAPIAARKRKLPVDGFDVIDLTTP